MAKKSNSVVTSLLFNIAANSAELTQGLKAAQSQLQNFGKLAGKALSAFGVGISAVQIGSFIKDCALLEAKASGIVQAFNNLDSSVKLMHDLRSAVNGTVDDVSLMRSAVQAANFGLDIENLPTLFEFAARRAQETGQSIDYLTESIVLGLSRKSIPILDNLGISATQINKELQKTPDFVKAVGNIVSDQLPQMNKLLDNQVTKVQRLSAAWERFQRFVGESANESGLLGGAVDATTGVLDIISDKDLSALDKIFALVHPAGTVNAVVKKFKNEQERLRREQIQNARVTQDVNKAYQIYGKNIEAFSNAIAPNHINKTKLIAAYTKLIRDEEEKEAKSIENINNLTEQLNTLMQNRNYLTGDALKNANKEIELIEKKIDALKRLGKEEKRELDDKLRQRISDFNYKSFVDTTDVSGQQTGGQFGSALPTSVDTSELYGGLSDRMQKDLDFFNEQIEEQEGKVLRLATVWESLGESINEALSDLGARSVIQLGNALGDLFVKGESGFKQMIGSMIAGIRQLIQANLAAAMSNMAATEARKGLPGLIAAGIGIAALEAMWASFPQFAAGGTMGRSGFAMVGEKGAELVHLPGGARVYNNAQTQRMLSNANDMRIEVVGKISGDDIYLMNLQAARKRGVRI